VVDRALSRANARECDWDADTAVGTAADTERRIWRAPQSLLGATDGRSSGAILQLVACFARRAARASASPVGSASDKRSSSVASSCGRFCGIMWLVSISA
jgi:hypothetical protein